MAEREDFGRPPAHTSLRDATGTRLELAPNRVYVLGRDADCDVQIEDSGCSRRHARIVVSGDARTLSLEDLKSKNGTVVNGQRVRGRVQLKTADRIQVGSVTFVVEIRDDRIDVPFDTRTTILRKP